MPRIDPSRLLKTLTPLLEPTSGAIKSDKEVDKLYGLMSKFSKKLVSKCVYINILNSTDAHTLDLFMQRGGWGMVYTWIIDATEHKNYSILTEVLHLLLRTPATIDRLKENELPKLIKNLSRDCIREETKVAARQVYDKWMAIAQNRDVPVEPPPNPVALSTIDSNLISFQLPVSHSTSTASTMGLSTLPSSSLPESTSIVIMEGEHDLTHYIDNTDLTTLETDFNPDDFNNTVDQHLALDGIGTDGGSIVSDASYQVHNVPDSQVTQAPVEDNNYCVIEKDGKRFLIKLHVVKDSDGKTDGIAEVIDQSEIGSVQAEDPVKKGRKRPRKDTTVVVTRPKVTIGGKPKMSVGGKPKMSIGGKPPIKTYEAKTKQAENKKVAASSVSHNSAEGTSASPFASGIPNFYKNEAPGTGPAKAAASGPSSSPQKKEAAPRPRSGSKSAGTGTKRGSSKSSAEAARKAAEEEKLRQKVSEQKRIRDQRKKLEQEKIEKVQKEKDDETLKALNIKMVSPQLKMPKIPKKAASFSDMIGIPGVTKEKTSVESKKSSSKPTKENDKSKTKSKNETDVVLKPEPIVNPVAPAKERKHRVKVFNTGKSRSLGLLEDMEQTLDKANKDKDKDKDKDLAHDISDVEIPNSVILGTGKPTKRPSIDGLVKPGDPKKPKLDEKERKRLEKEAKAAAAEAKKPKNVGIQESSLFMDAIKASSSAKSTRSKRRTSSSGEKDLLSPTVTVAEASAKPTKVKSSPPDEEPVKPVFNFYRDTLTEEEEPQKDDANVKDELATKAEDDKMDTSESPEVDLFLPGEDEGKLKSALVILRPKNKPKKSVQWLEEDKLKQFHYFEMDETERVNVSRPAGGGVIKNFAELKSLEQCEEKNVMVIAKRRSLIGVVDRMEEQMNWKSLTKIDFVKEIPEVQVISQELLVQEEREKGILGVVYFFKTQIPDCPEEPEDVLVLNQDDAGMKNMPWEDIPNVTNFASIHMPQIQWDPTPGQSFVMNHKDPQAKREPPGNPNGLLPDGFNVNEIIQQNPTQFGNMDPIVQQVIAAQAQGQVPFNLWNGNPFNIPPAGGMPPNADVWNMAAAAAAASGGAQQGFPGMNPAMNMGGAPPGFQMNPFGFNPGFPPPGMIPPQQQHQEPPNQADGFQQFGPGDQQRFNGPPQRGGRGGGRGRPNDHHNRHNNHYRGDRDDRDGNNDDFRRGDRDDRNHNGRGGSFNRDRDNNSDRGRGHYDRSRNNSRGGGGRDRDDRRGGGGGDRDNRGGPGERNRGARTVICKFFKQGFCKVGDKCDFLHPGINGPERGRNSRFSSRGSSPPSRSNRSDSPPRSSRNDRDRDRDRERDSGDRDSDRDRDRGRERRNSRDQDNAREETPASPPPPASPAPPMETSFFQPPSSPTNEEAAMEMAEVPKLIPNETE